MQLLTDSGLRTNKSGLFKGQVYHYYFDPQGAKFLTKKAVREAYRKQKQKVPKEIWGKETISEFLCEECKKNYV